MNHPTLDSSASLEQHLRHPPLIPAPPRLHARVMARIEGLPAPAQPALSLMVARFALPAAACIAAAAAAALMLSRPSLPQPSPQPVQASASPTSSEQVVVAMVDPAPIFFPAAQFLAASLDEHLANEARCMLDDTRAAADFVVSCLPFARGG